MSERTRPAENESLGMWVGRWHSEFVTTTAGSEDARRSEARQSFEWILDGMVLREELTADLGDAKYRQMVLNAWDPQEGKFRFWTFDNTGLTGGGWRTYDEAGRTWRWTFRVREADGTVSVGEGESRFVSDDEIRHRYTVWDEGRTRVRSAAEGTSRRVAVSEEREPPADGGP